MAKSTKEKELAGLTTELSNIAVALEKQNSFKRRILLGILFGVGTAIGASIIASLIILTVARFFEVTGLKGWIDTSSTQQLIEGQIKLQTPSTE